MPTLTMKRIEDLSAVTDKHRLTIYSPLAQEAGATRVNNTRMRSLISRGRDLLKQTGVEDEIIEKMTGELMDEAQSHLQAGDGTLAVFTTPHHTQFISVPVSLKERVEIGAESFLLRPLLVALSRQFQYFALVVSLNHVGLFFGDWLGAREIPLPQDVPTALDTVDVHEQSPRFSHRTFQGAVHGDRPDARAEIEHRSKYIKEIAHKISPMVEDIPIVLFGVHELTSSLKRELPSDMTVYEVHGNFEHAKADDLAERAGAAVKEGRRKAEQRILERWEETVPALRTAGCDRCLHAARAGAVETLILTLQPGEEELSRTMEAMQEAVARHTISQGGEVLAVDRPMEQNPLAILRFEMFPDSVENLPEDNS